MTTQSSLLVLWVMVAVLGVAGGTAVFVWAVRRRQFSDQDRARYLPFLGQTPEPKDETSSKRPGPPEHSESQETGHVPH